MPLLSNFDPYSDFYSDPQLRLIFKDEYEADVPSTTMWALMLYAHPESKYYSLDNDTKIELIAQDYLNTSFSPDEHIHILEKIDKFLLSKPQRLLKT